MSKGAQVALATIAAASLLAVAYLLGRLSALAPSGPSPARAAPPPAPSAVSRAAEPTREPEPPFARDEPQADPAVARPVPQPEVVHVPEGRTAPAQPGPVPTSDPARAAVAAYFEAIDGIQPAKLGGDAQAVANEMAAALVRGDTSGLDKLIRETEAAKASLLALTAPAPCATHHRESLASVEDALQMLGSLKSAMESPEPAARLASVAERAGALRSRAEALEREEQALRQRYGLTR